MRVVETASGDVIVILSQAECEEIISIIESPLPPSQVLSQLITVFKKNP